jgi:hypothetical protein
MNVMTGREELHCTGIEQKKISLNIWRTDPNPTPALEYAQVVKILKYMKGKKNKTSILLTAATL